MIYLILYYGKLLLLIENSHSEIRLKGEGSYIVATPSIHPNNINGYTLANGINPITLTREQINKLIEIFTDKKHKIYNKSNFIKTNYIMINS